ncbi:MAG: hypothetical protein AABZ60_14890 [Planctomycetota bacterium]
MNTEENKEHELLIQQLLVSETDSEEYKKALEYVKQLPPNSEALAIVISFIEKILLDENRNFSNQRAIIQLGLIGKSAHSVIPTLYEYSAKLSENSPLHASISWTIEKITGEKTDKEYKKARESIKKSETEVQSFFGYIFFGVIAVVAIPLLWKVNFNPGATNGLEGLFFIVLILGIPAILVVLIFSFFGMFFGKSLKLDIKKEKESLGGCLSSFLIAFIILFFNIKLPKFSSKTLVLSIVLLPIFAVIFKLIQRKFRRNQKDSNETQN